MSNSSLKKSYFKEDQEGFESPIKSTNMIESLANNINGTVTGS